VKKQEEAMKRQEEAIRLLVQMGMKKEDIASNLKISLSDIEKVFSN
jgi:DNA-binding NarL/FixJ family response regulator